MTNIASGQQTRMYTQARLSPRNTAKGNSPDPAQSLRFGVSVDLSDVPNLKGLGTIGRFTECTGLGVEYEVLTYEEGGQNDFVHKLRGRAKHPNLVLKRGVTNENALIQWWFACKDKTKRKDITVTLYGPDGEKVREWNFAGAFPVKWTGPNFNAGQSQIATETLEIAHQGFAQES